ncbi:MAG: family 43 glycosylhydrolase, partial [Sedimentisphaerales bacterium]|nr:family 43 glycosylhydrolase [Sedimentisphaerales bacterium]
MLKFTTITVLATLLSASCYSQETTNQPPRPGRPDRAEMQKLMDKSISPQAYYIHDPVMIKHGDYYYVFSTNDGIKISRSSDMKNFERAGRVFDKLPGWMPEHIKGINSLWAPDISYRDGLYYLYYSASSFGSRNSLIGL